MGSPDLLLDQATEKDKDDARVAEKEERLSRLWVLDVASRSTTQVATTPLRIAQISGEVAQPDLEDRFWAIDGSVYHVDPTITRFGPRKPAPGFAGYRTPVPGLFLTGSGTHPVAGISGMLPDVISGVVTRSV